MSTRIPLLVLLGSLLAIPLAAQQPPVITSVTPLSAPTTGGTPVLITGIGLGVPPNFACFAPCPATVRFDRTEVAAREESDTRLVVIAPGHEAGTVTLTVRTGDGRTAVATSAFTYTPAAEASYEKVLVPVYAETIVPGEKGSQWQTELWFRNNGSGPLSVAPWSCDPQLPCPPVFPSSRGVLPGESFKNLSPFDSLLNGSAGRLVYVTRSGDYSINARLADISRRALNAGTEIEIVRENELLTGPAQLLNVPVDGVNRLMLRIYDADRPEARFRVRVWKQDVVDAAPYIDKELTATTKETGAFRLQPAYAQFAQFIDPLALIALPLSVRVEVTPLTPGSRFWTFVSITNNETQHVTTVTPQ